MSQTSGSFLLVTGGCRSGKSRFAQAWAESRGPRRLFLATAEALDEEMAERVRRHRQERGDSWKTVEEPLQVRRVLEEHGDRVDVVLLDCVTLWLTNLLMKGLEESEILSQVEDFISAAARMKGDLVLVTNEVGWGVVPENPMARQFRDLVGWANQRLARTSDLVVLLVSGMPLQVKGVAEEGRWEAVRE